MRIVQNANKRKRKQEKEGKTKKKDFKFYKLLAGRRSKLPRPPRLTHREDLHSMAAFPFGTRSMRVVFFFFFFFFCNLRLSFSPDPSPCPSLSSHTETQVQKQPTSRIRLTARGTLRTDPICHLVTRFMKAGSESSERYQPINQLAVPRT